MGHWPRVGVWCALVALAVGGCGGSADQAGGGSPSGGSSGSSSSGGSGPKLLFVSNGNSDWWTAVEKGMLAGGKEFGADVQLMRNNGDVQGQIQLLEQANSRSDVKGVAVSAIEADAEGVIEALRRLKESGKVVITVDSDVEESAADVRRAYIGTNNVKAGEVAGRAAAALRPKGGRVDVFVGKASAANARERKQGFFKGAGPAFAQGKVWEDQNDTTKAANNVQTVLASGGGADVLLGLWSYNAPAIAEEVARAPEARKRLTVVTFDLDEAAVSQIEDGNIDVSVCQNPYEMGYQGVKLLRALIEKDEKAVEEVLSDGKVRDTGVRVIVPKADSAAAKLKDQGDDVITIEEMKSWLASKGLKSS